LEKVRLKQFKLCLPLNCLVKNSEIVIKDKFETQNVIPFSDGNAFSLGNMDNDGFVLFTVTYAEKKLPRQTSILSQTEAHINGYSLFHTNLSKSYGYGGQKSVFEYYKRDSDLSYYALIKKEGKTRKVLLGSLRDPTSRIFQVTYIINEKFVVRGLQFAKGQLAQFLPKPLKGARIIKSTLDILTKEGYLEASEGPSGKRNRPKEVFSKTDKLDKFMADPRSWQKTNGLNIGSSAMTPNQ
jgi:hypothetical protein